MRRAPRREGGVRTRAGARRAGVSHNAPYKHFVDKSELLAAVSAAGFELLTKLMAGEMAGFPSPRAQLFTILRTYIVLAWRTRRSTA